tara:strand:+ start:472 stop:1014 length:543 start_codon:yes stop_codon:yes gene_type:complete
MWNYNGILAVGKSLGGMATQNLLRGGSDESQRALFQNQLRNVGLFLTLSMGALTYSRVFRNASKWRNYTGIFIATVFLCISIHNSYMLWKDVALKLDWNHKVLMVCLNVTHLVVLFMIFLACKDESIPPLLKINRHLEKLTGPMDETYTKFSKQLSRINKGVNVVKGELNKINGTKQVQS